jgi:hypothetical protein
MVFLIPLVLFGLSAVFCGPFALVGILLTSPKIRPKLTALKPDDLSPLLPDPAPTRLFRTSIAYLDGSLVVGEDDIAFSFVDGWLIGQGVRSDFALRREDVEAVTAPIHGHGFLYLRNGQRVRLQDLHAYAREYLLEWHEAEIPVVGRPTFPPLGIEPRQILKTQAKALSDLALLILAFPTTFLAWSIVGGFGVLLGGGAIAIALSRLGHDVADLFRYRSIRRLADRHPMVA